VEVHGRKAIAFRPAAEAAKADAGSQRALISEAARACQPERVQTTRQARDTVSYIAEDRMTVRSSAMAPELRCAYRPSARLRLAWLAYLDSGIIGRSAEPAGDSHHDHGAGDNQVSEPFFLLRAGANSAAAPVRALPLILAFPGCESVLGY
jgi:hypothetical protein